MSEPLIEAYGLPFNTLTKSFEDVNNQLMILYPVLFAPLGLLESQSLLKSSNKDRAKTRIDYRQGIHKTTKALLMVCRYSGERLLSASPREAQENVYRKLVERKGGPSSFSLSRHRDMVAIAGL